MLRKILIAAALIAGTAQVVLAADAADPQKDFKAFRDFFTQRFPKVPLNDFVNGPYSMDEGLRAQWKAIDEFPPYEFAVEKGKEMFATPFKNGKSYGDCFANKGIGIRQNYPYFDETTGECYERESMWQRFVDRVLRETQVKERWGSAHPSKRSEVACHGAAFRPAEPPHERGHVEVVGSLPRGKPAH